MSQWSYGANLRPSIQHAADPMHPLHLVNVSASSSRRGASCDACAGKIETGFSYCCVSCNLDLHTVCASMPPSMHLHAAHPHPLALVFAPPYDVKGFTCDLCKGGGGDHWLYRCRNCDFDAHLHCASAADAQQQQQIQTRSIPTVGTMGVGNGGGHGAPAVSFPQAVNPAPSLGTRQSQGTGAWTSAYIVSPGVNGLANGLMQQIAGGLFRKPFGGDGAGGGAGGGVPVGGNDSHNGGGNCVDGGGGGNDWGSSFGDGFGGSDL